MIGRLTFIEYRDIQQLLKNRNEVFYFLTFITTIKQWIHDRLTY